MGRGSSDVSVRYTASKQPQGHFSPKSALTLCDVRCGEAHHEQTVWATVEDWIVNK